LAEGKNTKEILSMLGVSVENLPDISEPQVILFKQKDP